MAARRAPRISTGKGNDIVVVNTAPAPVARRSGRRRRRSGGGIQRRRSRRRSSGKSTAAGYQGRLIATAGAGFAYAIVEKNFPDIPIVPMIGKSGTIAIACYLFGRNNHYIRDVGIAAAVLAGYSFGKDGKISGDDYEATAIET